MPCLVSDIVSEAIVELSQVPGIATQVYATPRLTQQAQSAIILMMDELWWPDLMEFYTVAPDGVTGVITSDLVSPHTNHQVSRYQDIQSVFPSNGHTPLKQLPPRRNPYLISGTATAFIAPSATYPLRPFRVWPVTAAGALVVHARSYPKLPISLTDTVYLDRLLITYLTAYMHAEDDGTNPGQITKFKGMFEKRLEQVKAAWQQQSIVLDPRFPITEAQWTERE